MTGVLMGGGALGHRHTQREEAQERRRQRWEGHIRKPESSQDVGGPRAGRDLEQCLPQSLRTGPLAP